MRGLQASSLFVILSTVYMVFQTSLCYCFTISQQPSARLSTIKMVNQNDFNNQNQNRGVFLKNVGSGILGGLILPQLIDYSKNKDFITPPANALSQSSANKELAKYGISETFPSIPSGFSPAIEVYGKQNSAKKARSTYLVKFLYPFTWVISRPNIDANGEEGTVSAGDYQKGDSATFFTGDLPESGDFYTSKGAVQDVVQKAISQKGDNLNQELKILKSYDSVKDKEGKEYKLVEFKYELLTGAGFTVDRKGVASITTLPNNQVGAMVTATTAVRFKKIGDDLKTVCESFRVFDGIKVGDIN